MQILTSLTIVFSALFCLSTAEVHRSGYCVFLEDNMQAQRGDRCVGCNVADKKRHQAKVMKYIIKWRCACDPDYENRPACVSFRKEYNVRPKRDAVRKPYKYNKPQHTFVPWGQIRRW